MRFDGLLQVIHSSLISLSQAIKGEVVLTEQLERMKEALIMNKVPYIWMVGELTKWLISNVTSLVDPDILKVRNKWNSDQV